MRHTARHTLILTALVIGVLASCSLTPRTADASPSHATVSALGAQWFAHGASVPYLRRGCDFGCGAGGGLSGSRDRVDRLLRGIAHSSTNVVEWELFSGDAWQVRRDSTGMPIDVSPVVQRDLDLLVQLARKHDLFLVLNLFPQPDELPVAWFTDAQARIALARALTPMTRRLSSEKSVLGVQLMSTPQALVATGAVSADDVRATAQSMLEAARPTKTMLIAGAASVDALSMLRGTSFDAYVVGGTDPLTNPSSIRHQAGIDAPVLAAFNAASSASDTLALLHAYARAGYAGTIVRSWTGMPGDRSRPQLTALRDFGYRVARSGPRSRPRNPCLGPDARTLLCPNLRMSIPRDISLGRIGRRTVLYSTNSLDSVGAGPASLRGVRSGRFTMAARQVLHRRRGQPLMVATNGRLSFKAIPGQFRYWKWDGAAQMELWRLDASGVPIRLERVGPKTVYCLRDLKRTRPGLARSPRTMRYPGCSQNLRQQRVTLGTSVGWSDVYPATYFENWVDVTNLRGCFAYVHVADPTNVIYESNEDDNRSSVVVRLPFRGTNAGCPRARPLPVSGQNGLGY